jgi:hypothetical protein
MAEKDTKKNVDLAEKEVDALRKGRTIRQEYSKTVDELVKKQEKLNDLEKDSVKNKSEIVKLQTSIEVSQKKVLDLEEKSKKNQEELKKYSEERKQAEQEAEERLDKSEKADRRLLTLKRETNTELNLSQQLMEKLGENSAKFSEEASGARQLLKQQTNILAQSEIILQNQKFITKDFVQELEAGKSVTSDIVSLEKEVVGQIDKAAIGQYQEVDLSKQKELLERKIVELKDESSGMTAAEREQALALVEQQKNALQTLEAQNKQMKNMSDQAAKTLGTFNKFAELDFKGGIRQYFELDKLKSDMKDKLGKTILEVTEAVRGGKGLSGAFKAAGSNLAGMSKVAGKMAIGLGIGGIVAGVGLLAKAVMHADEEVANLGKEFGISYKEARGLHHAAIDISNEMGLTGIQAKEVTAAMADVGEMMGGIDIAAQMSAGNEKVKELVKQTAILTKQFGLSGEEVGKIQDLATITGKSMDNLVKESVELGKGTMTAKQSLKVLSTIPPQVAVAFKGSTKELIAAAQKAKMLGMELGKVQQIGRGMLDIEQSLEAEMEARVLTGKNLNLDAARQYALQGDTFKLQEEILNQAGSLEDFTKMNTLQQESMAKALGMSVEEMTKMLTNAEKLKKADISSDYAARLDAMESAAELEKEAAGARSKEQKDYIMQLAAEKRSASLKETMASLLEKIKAKFAPIIDAVLGVVGGLKDGNAGVSKFEEIISQIDFKEIAEQVKAVLPKLIEGFTTLIKKLPDIIKMVANFVEKLSGGIGPVTSIMGMINPGIAGFGIMALKIGGPGGVATGLKLAAGGAKGLFDLVKGPLQDGIGKLAGGVTDKLGGAFGKVADKAKSGLGGVMEKMGKVKTPEAPKSGGGGFMKGLTDAFKNINTTDLIKAAAAMLILAAALYVVAKALQEFGSVEWESIAKGGVALLGLVGIAYLFSKGSTEMIKGAAAMVILGAALWVIGFALQMFTKIGWEDLAKAGVALVGFSLAVAGLGFLLAPIAVGVAALSILSVGILAFSVSMTALALATSLFEKSVGGIMGQINKLVELDGDKLLKASAGILALGAALGAFGVIVGAGGTLGAIGGALTSLFGGKSPVEQVMEISGKIDGAKLSATAQAIKDLANAFKYFAEETAKLKEFDTDKLQQIIEKMEEVKDVENSGALSKSVTGVANAVTGFIGNIFGSPEKQSTQPVSAGGGSVAVAASGGGGTNMANVEKKLDTLISVISQAANQPLVIKFGEKTVEEIKSQLNFKAATSIGVNNKTYAKTI